MEGMAEYLSLGPIDVHTAMWLRDAALEGNLPTIEEMTYDPRVFPYHFGHALWSYIGEKWGDEVIGEILQASTTSGIDGAFKRALGLLGLPGDCLDRSAEVLCEIDEMATDVGEGTGARPAAVSPAGRRARVAAVVAPVMAIEVQRLAQRPGSDLLANGTHRRGSAERVPDGVDDAGLLCSAHHRLRIRERAGQRLLAQYVLARRHEAFDDLAVQAVGHDHADRFDVGGLRNGLPATLGTGEAVPTRGIACEFLIGVGDRDQTYRWKPVIEHGCSRPVGIRMRPPRHASADHRHTDW